jgi:hypothetical protein
MFMDCLHFEEADRCKRAPKAMIKPKDRWLATLCRLPELYHGS